MGHLLDTSIVVRRIVPGDPQGPIASGAIEALHQQSEPIYVTPQVLIEFRAVATRPADVNGLGMTAAEAQFQADRLETIFPILDEVPAIYPVWKTLVETYGVVGRQVFDARLVAVMTVHGITHIVTFNVAHFRRFAGITVVSPDELRRR